MVLLYNHYKLVWFYQITSVYRVWLIVISLGKMWFSLINTQTMVSQGFTRFHKVSQGFTGSTNHIIHIMKVKQKGPKVALFVMYITMMKVNYEMPPFLLQEISITK